MRRIPSRAIFFFLAVLLTVGRLASSGPKSILPMLDGADLLAFASKHEGHEDHLIYLFSTLPLASIRKEMTVFAFSNVPFKYLLPTLTIEMFPTFDVRIQSEFFDFTIWGQLGNYFNKNLELILLENQIITLFEELEQINRKYKNTLMKDSQKSLYSDSLVTLDRKNYLEDIQEQSSGQLSRRKEIAGQKAMNADIEQFIQQHENRLHLSRLNFPWDASLKGSDPVDDHFALGAHLRASEPDHPLRTSGGEANGIIIRIFRTVSEASRYLIDNRAESMVYLLLLLLLVTFVRTLFAS